MRESSGNPNSSILEDIYIRGSPVEIQTPAYWKLYIYINEIVQWKSKLQHTGSYIYI